MHTTESQASSLLKDRVLYVDGTLDDWGWTNSKTITDYTKELPE